MGGRHIKLSVRESMTFGFTELHIQLNIVHVCFTTCVHLPCLFVPPRAKISGNPNFKVDISYVKSPEFANLHIHIEALFCFILFYFIICY